MKLKGLLTLKDLSVEKIMDLLSYSLKLKKGYQVSYENKRFVTLFFENSTRTHYSFIMAMKKLGIDVIDCNTSFSSTQKGESLYDTVKTFESIGVDGVVIRHSQDEYFKELDGINIPVFNGGDGKSNHPTQSLLDLMTIYEEYGKFEGLKCCIVGDISHSRVAHTNIEIMQRLGMDVYISGPEEYNDGSAKYLSLDEAIETCDVIMLLRVQFERHTESMKITKEDYHKQYGLTMDKVNKMKENAIIMHPAPFNRGLEIADEVVECEKSRIYKQMTNGVYVRMAAISMVLDGKL
ncbi:MAG: aspartate carbamoyltransferase catalytic subunit [Bacilli bacterium]|nr:aspartate carbamoyltransferase catalytic subunit [Bacilli bacterium]